MNRAQQLQFCRKCTNRKLDLKVGLICNLTGEKADFEEECPSFNLDETVPEQDMESQNVSTDFAMGRLSDEQQEKFRSEQNYQLALITGIAVGLLGAFLWTAITLSTEYQIGYMALAIGAGVGFSMRFTGKGIDQKFGITGAIIAFLSCLLGNFLSAMGFIAAEIGMTLPEFLQVFDYSQTFAVIMDFASPIDLLFYGIAIYEAYRFAFRKFSENELVG